MQDELHSGAMTVAEVSATGLPAVYVPLPHGNGEQRLNAVPIVDAGGGVIVDDADMSTEWVATHVPAMMADKHALAAMSQAALSTGHRDAAEAVAAAALELARSRR